MSKQSPLSSSKGKAPLSHQRRGRGHVLWGLAIGLCLFTALVIMAQQPARKAPRKAAPRAETVRAVAQTSPTPTPPTKEYIYAGGKLLATEEQRFNDVPISHEFYHEINVIAEHGVTLGCGGGNYCVGDNVLRSQMAAFIIRALHVNEPGYVPPPPAQQRFSDVPPTHGFYAHIEEMAVREITLGCGGGNYCPDAYVTHEQMAAFMERALHEAGWTPQGEPPPQAFCDVPPTHIFYFHIKYYAVDRQAWLGCGSTGICDPAVPGCPTPQKCFCPTALVTRAQMARILVRNFNL